MTKTILLVIGIIIAIAAIGGALVMSNRSNSSNPTASSETTSNSSFPKSLKELLALNQSQECNFSDENGNSGVVYLSAGKMRGDFVSSTGQGSLNSHMIVSDNTSYVWMDGQNTGFKISFDPNEIEIPEGTQSTVSLDQKFDFSCKDWSANTSVFAMPTSINFTDFGSLNLPTGSSAPKIDCSVCDSVPESAKPQCKAALGCN